MKANHLEPLRVARYQNLSARIMTSLEQAKALMEELKGLWPTPHDLAIIQKHMDAFANGAKAAVIAAELRIARLVGENAHLKGALSVSQSRLVASAKLDERDALELLKDKERLDLLEKLGELKHIYEEGRPEVTIPVIHVPAFTFDFAPIPNPDPYGNESREASLNLTIRQALDKAALAKERTE